MCNMCRLLNDLDFPLLIAHCSLLISGARFRGSMRERYFRRILSPRGCPGNVNGAGRGIQGEGPCFFHTLRKFLHRVRMSGAMSNGQCAIVVFLLVTGVLGLRAKERRAKEEVPGPVFSVPGGVFTNEVS